MHWLGAKCHKIWPLRCLGVGGSRINKNRVDHNKKFERNIKKTKIVAGFLGKHMIADSNGVLLQNSVGINEDNSEAWHFDFYVITG